MTAREKIKTNDGYVLAVSNYVTENYDDDTRYWVTRVFKSDKNERVIDDVPLETFRFKNIDDLKIYFGKIYEKYRVKRDKDTAIAKTMKLLRDQGWNAKVDIDGETGVRTGKIRIYCFTISEGRFLPQITFVCPDREKRFYETNNEVAVRIESELSHRYFKTMMEITK